MSYFVVFGLKVKDTFIVKCIFNVIKFMILVIMDLD